MSSLTLKSPAKLNLYLKVKNKRKDGFHNIVTLFERIDLCDEIRLRTTKKDDIKIVCDNKDIPLGPKNTVFKAVKLIKERYAVKKGININIKKRIPVAAGLAGGSSNAATVIKGLNKIWELRLTSRQLLDCANEIGSDVSFFISDQSWAVGRGRGNRLKKVKIAKKLWHILVVPKVKVYSAKVYGTLKLQLTKPSDNVNILIHNLRYYNISKLCEFIENDLETSVIKYCPSLVRLKKKLKILGAKGVTISGSGPAVFGITETEKEARMIRSSLLKEFSRVYIVKTQ